MVESTQWMAKLWERLNPLPLPVQSKGCDNESMVVEPMKSLLTAKVSTTEESREEKLHAGICAGDAEQSAFLL